MSFCTSDKALESSNSIAVSIRIRTPCEPLVSPRLRHEIRHNARLTNHWRWKNNTMYFGEGEAGQAGSFDNIFTPECSNEIVYKKFASSSSRAVLAGYNATIFAYGQTNAGKTFTTCGTEEDMGFFPRAANDLLTAIRDDPLTESSLRVSIVELYNESLRDLLLEHKTDNSTFPSSDSSLFLTEDPIRGTIIANAREIYVDDMGKVMDLLCLAKRNRVTERNSAHINASRSHLIFHLIYEARVENEDGDGVRVSTLRIVDMAGGEVPINFDNSSPLDADTHERSLNIACMGSNVVRKREDYTRSSEGAFIRKSLLALVRCMELVRTNQSNARKEALRLHYRDSKLTRLLCDTLEGSTLTAILCNINPNEQRETLATLRFALCAQGVQIRPSQVSLRQKPTSAHLGYRKMSQEKHVTSVNRATGSYEIRLLPKFRSVSPTPNLLKEIESKNIKCVEECFSDHLLGRIKARLSPQWSINMREKEEQLEDVLSAVCHARKLLSDSLRESDVKYKTARELARQVMEIETDVRQLSNQRESCEQILRQAKRENFSENEFYLKKCAKYLDILGSSRWQMLKNSPLNLFNVSRRQTHVDPILIVEFRGKLLELVELFECTNV